MSAARAAAPGQRIERRSLAAGIPIMVRNASTQWGCSGHGTATRLPTRRRTMRVIGLLGLMVLALLLAPAAAEEKKGKLDPAKLVGTWTYVSGMRNGKEVSADDLKKGTVEITKDTITLKSPDGNYVIKYELDQE